MNGRFVYHIPEVINNSSSASGKQVCVCVCVCVSGHHRQEEDKKKKPVRFWVICWRRPKIAASATTTTYQTEMQIHAVLYTHTVAYAI